MVRSVVEAFGLTQLEVPGFEADDIIATLAKIAVAAGMEVVICSSDKDLMQLVRRQRRGARHHEEPAPRAPPRCSEKFGVPPEQIGDVLALMGDSVDNVPGVPGIGPKTAAELINKYGSLEALLAAAGEIKGKRGAAIVEAARGDRASPASSCACATTSPCRRRSPSCTGSSRTSSACASCSASSSSRGWSSSFRRPAPPRSRPHAEAHAAAGGRPRSRRAAAAARRRSDHQTEAELAALVAAMEAAGGGGGGGALRRSVGGPLGPRRDRLRGRRERRAYLPLRHRYLGAPACLPEARGPRRPRPDARARPRIAKHAHDAKTLEVLLRRRGLRARRASRPTRCSPPTCSTPRAPATTSTSWPRRKG